VNDALRLCGGLSTAAKFIRNVTDLTHQIMNYIRLYNRNAQPFHWTYSNPNKRICVSLSSVTAH
jgi:hypothetical protein